MIKLYNGNGGEVEITPSDDSYRLKELMGADEVVLKFALPDYLAISAGAYITYKGDRYEVESEDSVRMIHTEEYEYTVTFSSPRAHLRRYIVREKGGEGRISFFLTAKAREHLDLIVHNLNEREAGWSVGACLEGSEKTIEYSTTNALDALAKLAEAYGTEWECEGRTLSLRKAEYHRDSPLTVSYGKGKGLLSGLERNPAEEQPVGTLYVTGTDRNIDPAKYKSKTLHLPEGGTKTVGGRTYTVTSGGRAITISGSAPNAVEGAFTDTDIYPSREGVVKAVTIKNKEKAFVDFTDPTIPADLDFEQRLIPGREMKLTFQTGMLAGRTFGAKYHHKDRRFEIVPEEIDGILMPSAPYLPKEGDRYGVFEIALPESYISAAERRLLDSAVQYLEGLETSRYSYRAAVDPLWLKKQWTKVGHKVRIGAYVRLAGDPITDGGATLRITGIKEYLTDPYAPEVTLSDRATGRGGLTSIIRKAVQEDLTSTREASTRTAVEQAHRTFHRAVQLTDALEKTLGAHFDAMVRPLAVHTMQVLVGDKSLQFAYVESKSSTKEVPLPLTFDQATKSLHIDRAYLQHKTLGVEVTTAHTAKDFRTWTIAPIDYSPKGTAPLYLYAKVPREGDGGTFVIDTRAHDFEEEAGYYHLWSGMLTPTDDGARWEYMPMHGFTEITPGMISSPRFTSPDGRLVIDMVKGYFRFKTDKSTFSINADNPNGVYIRGGMTSVGGQNLTLEEAFEEQERKLREEEEARKKATAEAERKRKELEEALEGLRKSTGDEQAAMAEILGKVNKTLTSLQEQVDKEVSNWFYHGAPGPDKEPESEWVTNQDKYRHIGDTYTSVDESGEYMGKSWRYTTEFRWQEIHDTLISKALAVAAKAQTTADGKSTTYYTQPAHYSVGDSWVLSADTTVGGKKYTKGTMLFANSSSDVYVGAHWSDMLKYIDSAKLEADLRASEKKSKQAWEAYAAAKASKAGEDAVKAAKEYAEAQDAAHEERTKAYADKILTEKEQALIAAADAKANLAEKRAKAYADGKITETERLAIDKAAAAYKAAVKKAKELDGEIQVGGRNLARASALSAGEAPGTFYIPIDCYVGETYTLSFEYMITLDDPATNRRISVFERTAEGKDIREIAWDKNITIDGKWHKWSYTFTITNAATVAIHGWALDYSRSNGRVRGKTADARQIKLERGSLATDWTPAPEDVQSEIDAAKEQTTKAQQSTDKLRGYVDGAFRDGVVDGAEATAIKTYIQEVDAQWQSALGAYEKVYTNPLLTGSPKTALLDCKTTLAGKCDALTQYIATAIADGRATAAEVDGVNFRYNAYKIALRDFQKALKVAEEAIRDATVGEVGSGSLNYLPADVIGSDKNRSLISLRLANGFFQAVPVGVEVPINIGYDVYFDNDRTDNKIKTTLFYTDEKDNYKDGSRRYIIVSRKSGLKGRTWHHIWASGKAERLDKHVRIMGWLADTVDTGTYPSEVRNVYLRVGSRDLGWTPAPEDLQAEIERERTERETAVREVEQGLSSAQSSISALQTAKDEIESGKLSISDLPKNLKWIYDAFHNGETEIEGGLILSKYIGLSNSSDKVTSYISGQDGPGAHMLAAGVSSLADQDAVSYINYDGSARFGNLEITKYGHIYIYDPNSDKGIWITPGGINIYQWTKDNGPFSGYDLLSINIDERKNEPYIRAGGGEIRFKRNGVEIPIYSDRLVPKILGMGYIDDDGSMERQQTFDESIMYSRRLGEGEYRLTFSSKWSDKFLYFVGNAQYLHSQGNQFYVSFERSFGFNYVNYRTADDSSRNDAAIFFQIIEM